MELIKGEVLNNNGSMLKLMRRLEFNLEANPEDGSLITVSKNL